MTQNTETKESVYGENHPASEDTRPNDEGIREQETREVDEEGQDTAQSLEEARRINASRGETHGGMGREETPKDGETEGTWHHDTIRDADVPRD